MRELSQDQSLRRAHSAVVKFAIFVACTLGGQARAITLVETGDPGFYNNGIGTLLNGTSEVNGKPHFPVGSDPFLDFELDEEPDLSSAASVLGGWLDQPVPDLSASGWSDTPIAVPANWPVGTEVAIVYEFESVAITGLLGSFGVDNGIYVWLDGEFKGGAMRPGGVSPGEHVFDLGDLSFGTHYLQILLEDHGSTDGFDVLIEAETVVPEPSIALLLAFGLAALAVRRCRAR
ncbi:MAG: PEP-CTERM sorting domain-containing protein [Myxococcota bacterium]|nr:PEP-CTERM sorting domain-containing protein [Myxococcota bacterium]